MKKRFANAVDCLEYTRKALCEITNRKDWEELEARGDLGILNTGNFVVTRRHIGYATEDKDEFDRLKANKD
jgi:hypothetical protein